MSKALSAQGQTVEAQTWMRAAEMGDAASVKALLAAGADVDATSAKGETALMRAAAKGYADVVQILLDAGAEVNARREDGFTPLIIAAFFGHEDVVGALLSRGADTKARTHLGSTAERCAASRGLTAIVRLLKDTEAARAAETSATKTEKENRRELTAKRAPLPVENAKTESLDVASTLETLLTKTTGAPVGKPLTAGDDAPRAGASDTAHVDHARDFAREDADGEEGEVTLVSPRSDSISTPTATPAVGVHFKKNIFSQPVTIASIALIFASVAVVYALWQGARPVTKNRQEVAPLITNTATMPVAPLPAPTPNNGVESQGVQPLTTEQNVQVAPQFQTAPGETFITVPPDSASSERQPKNSGPVGSPELNVVSEGVGRRNAGEPAAGRDTTKAEREKQPADSKVNDDDARQSEDARTDSTRRVQIPNAGTQAAAPSLPPPVYSPAPSPTPAKRKVIQWP